MSDQVEHKNVGEAILGVMSEVGYVQKVQGRNVPYSFASESDLIAALRPAMIKHGVMFRVIEILSISRESITLKSGTVMQSTLVHVVGRFSHPASDTTVDAHATGEGFDSGDKSANKALTGALKYLLRQTFLIETGDDPDASRPEQGSSERSEPTQGSAKGRSYPADVVNALVDNGFAENPFAAINMLNLVPYSTSVSPEEVIEWAKAYRKRREEGAEPKEAAMIAWKELAEA